MTSKQRAWGQFVTPIDVADLLLGFCLRRSDDRLLDPGCGDGALLRRAALWRSWLATDRPEEGGVLYGIELDPEAALAATIIPGAVIERANFFTLDPGNYPPFDTIIGNPPYTRAEWIAQIEFDPGQLALFPGEEAADARAAPVTMLPKTLSATLSGRAGLHAYFFLHSLGFLREGGRLGFVVPNGWLDVSYGEGLKRFLLDHFRIVAVIESAVERWFSPARVNTCLIILERAGEPESRKANRVRFVRLRQPLHELLGQDMDSRRMAAVEQLVTRLMPASDRVTPGASVRVREQGALTAFGRWGALLRAPEVYLHRHARPVAPLAEWVTVQRGYTTGANDFFYPDRKQVERWSIEPEFRRPLLKSLRGVRRLRLSAEDCRHEVLAIPGDADLTGTAVAEYIRWAESQGIAQRPTCVGRRPWYALPEQPDAALVLAKGVWQRHFAPAVGGGIVVDQQIYRVELADGIMPNEAAALLNSAWFALACELGGRVNLGEGVLWLAAYELAKILLPDPRTLDAATRHELLSCFEALAALPVVDTAEALERPQQRVLDDMVFDLVGLPPAERDAARTALLDCLSGRRLRARTPIVTKEK